MRTMRMMMLFVVLASLAAMAQKGGENETGPYEVVPNWPQPVCGPGYQSGSTGGVWAETPDTVFVLQRGCLPEIEPSNNIIPKRNASQYSLASDNPKQHPRWDHILVVYNREGKPVENWEQHNKLFVRPHRVVMNPYDPEHHVWIIDDGAHSIYKFTRNQKLIMTLGEFRKPGNDKTHFGRPTDIAWLPDGTFFVSDGYENTRVVKFDKDGKYLLEWGKPGHSAPYEFDTVHGIAIDNQRRVYVADRANHRVQIFDENGKFLDQWPNLRYPYYIYMSKDQHLWVGDGFTNKILKYDLNGKLLFDWGTFGPFPGGIWGPHQFSVDSENNFYIADVHNGRVQKFRPKPGADPATLVGQRFEVPRKK